MKKFLYLMMFALFTATTCLVTACGDDDDNTGGGTDNDVVTVIQLKRNRYSDGTLLYGVSTDNKAYVVGFEEGHSASALKIPANIKCEGKKYPVIGIYENAFKYSNTIISVTLPNTLLWIGNHAFNDCENLTNISFPSSLKQVGDYAFYHCQKIAKLDLKKIEEVGDFSFTHLDFIEELLIPATLTKIGTGTFCFSRFLNKIVVDANNPKYDSHDNSNAIIDKDTHTIIVGCQYTPEIPDDITTIGPYAFAYSFILGIAIKKNVTKIGYGAFEHCSLLKRVLNCQGLVTIGDYAFYSCTNLESLGLMEPITHIGSGAFANCTSLKDVYCSRNYPVNYNASADAFGPENEKINMTLHVTNMAAITAYKSLTPWKHFETIVDDFKLN